MKTLITFIYVERNNEIIQDNLRFFLNHAVIDNDDYHYNFVINGHECSIKIPESKNVSIIRRDNVGYDFGAYGASLESVDINDYDYFIFLNDTVRGPFLPTYIPNKITWVDMFLDKLDDKVKLVGPTMFGGPIKHRLGLIVSHIQSMSFGIDRVALNLLLKTSVFNPISIVKFDNNNDKMKYVLTHEVEMTLQLKNAGYDIKPFQLSIFDDFHLTEDINYEEKYFGITLNPLEVMFIKTNRIYNGYVKNYTDWFNKKR